MKKFTNIFTAIGLFFACAFLFAGMADAQLLINEVEIDPPNPTVISDRCQFVELRGMAGAAVPANTYFISINSDSDNFGFLNVAVNISGKTFGTNGTLTLLNSLQGDCPNRTFPAGTNTLKYNSLTSLGKNSEGFYIVTSSTNLFSGLDADTNNDGTVDFAITYVDGFNLIFNPEEQFKYGPGENLVTTFLGDVPDAATRFSNNDTPFSAGAFYSGELASTPEETTVYAAPFSRNFPNGGMLTPGAANVGTAINRNRFDFDGDGRSDLAVFRPSNNTAYVNRTTSGFAAFQFQTGANQNQFAPADYDGDGKTDFAVWREAAAMQANFTIILSSNNMTRTEQLGQTGDVPISGDFDGDGKADTAVYRAGASGSQSIFYYRGTNNNAGGNITFIPWGLSSDKPVRGDFDGDGRQDAAVFRPSNGTWYIRQSSNGQPLFVKFGLAADVLVPADYDGDGKTDIAVFRSGTWYILRSSDNQVRIEQFGSAGDRLVPTDYDGDGQADLAVYRSGAWIIKQSTNSSVIYRNFGIAGDTPAAAAYIR